MSWLEPPQPAFPTIALKTLRRFQQRPQAPPAIYTKRFIGIRRNKEGGINLVEAMENALPDFEEHSVVGQGLEPSGRWGRFPQPRLLNLGGTDFAEDAKSLA